MPLPIIGKGELIAEIMISTSCTWEVISEKCIGLRENFFANFSAFSYVIRDYNFSKINAYKISNNFRYSISSAY